MNKLLLLLSIVFPLTTARAQDSVTAELKALIDQKAYDKIIATYAENAASYPSKAVYYVGLAYYLNADDNNCLKFMDMAIGKDPADPEAHYIKGMTLQYLGQFGESVVSIKKAIELKPDKGNYYSGLGDAYFSMDQMEQALQAYQSAIENPGADDRPYTMIPQAYAALNKPGKALETSYAAKDKIGKASPSYRTILYNIGLYELLNRHYDKAESALVELNMLDPEDYTVYAKLSQVYYGKKEYAKAAPYREKLYELHAKGVLEGSLADMFCFDQFDWNDKLIQAFERFEVIPGELYFKHLFYVVDQNDRVEFRIQTENSPVSVELGGPKYLLGMDKDDTHYTFATGFNEGFQYEDLKKAVIDILEGKSKPIASSKISRN